MKKHILIVDDHEDIYENVERKIRAIYPSFIVSIADNCDAAFRIIKQHKMSNPVHILILDLTFKSLHPQALLKKGQDLMAALQKENQLIDVIIYSSHDEMSEVHPVLNNYQPKGYVIKSNSSSQELLLALKNVLLERTYYSQRIHELQLKRIQYSYAIDEIDQQIIRVLPNTNSMSDWEGKILKDGVPLSYKSIKSRIDILCQKLGQENEKQLLLKLQKLAII